jgi:hypothetical protein
VPLEAGGITATTQLLAHRRARRLHLLKHAVALPSSPRTNCCCDRLRFCRVCCGIIPSNSQPLPPVTPHRDTQQSRAHKVRGGEGDYRQNTYTHTHTHTHIQSRSHFHTHPYNTRTHPHRGQQDEQTAGVDGLLPSGTVSSSSTAPPTAWPSSSTSSSSRNREPLCTPGYEPLRECGPLRAAVCADAIHARPGPSSRRL